MVARALCERVYCRARLAEAWRAVREIAVFGATWRIRDGSVVQSTRAPRPRSNVRARGGRDSKRRVTVECVFGEHGAGAGAGARARRWLTSVVTHDTTLRVVTTWAL